MYHTDFDLNGWQELLDSDMGLFDGTFGDSTIMDEGMGDFEMDYSSLLSEQEESADPLSTCSNTSDVSDKQPLLDPEHHHTPPQPAPTFTHFQLQHLAPQSPTEPLAADQPIKTTPPCELCGREFKCLAGRKTHLKFCTGIDYAPTVRHRKRDELKEKRKRRQEKRIAKQHQQQHQHQHQHQHHQHQHQHQGSPEGASSPDTHPVPLASHFRGKSRVKRGEDKDYYVTDAHMAWIADSLSNLPQKRSAAFMPLPGMGEMGGPPSFMSELPPVLGRC